MSKKTNAAKQELAKRKHARKKPRKGRRPNPATGNMPILFHPFFGMGMMSNVLHALLGPLMPPMPVWYCSPCAAEIQLIHGRADGQVFCPKCRQPMRLHGKQQHRKPDGSIDVTFEPIPVTTIPARTLQIAAPKEPSK